MCVARILQLEAAANRALCSLSEVPACAPRVAKSLRARDMRLSYEVPASTGVVGRHMSRKHGCGAEDREPR
jgi:hypothetical protein